MVGQSGGGSALNTGLSCVRDEGFWRGRQSDTPQGRGNVTIMGAGGAVQVKMAVIDDGQRSAWISVAGTLIPAVLCLAWFKAGLHVERGEAGLTRPGRMMAP